MSDGEKTRIKLGALSGTVLSDFDKVIFCTGFTSDYSSLERLTVEAHDDYIQNGHESLEEPVTNGRFVINSFYDIFLIPDPTLAFVGVPPHRITLPIFDYQAKFLSCVWGGKSLLPTKEDMYSYKRDYKPFCHPSEASSDSEILRYAESKLYLGRGIVKHFKEASLEAPLPQKCPDEED
ncbi:hypothetical protein BDF14DRAFT_1886268 [Spinellus fusiger]|nr:hypothetical protein BDF14DRAFT_1886268 [Spinellus fusiger]